MLISRPLLNAVPLLASTWQGLLSHHIPPPHLPPPALSPLSFSLFLKLLPHKHHERNQTGTGPIVQQRGKKKKIIKKAGDLKKDQNYFSNRMGKSNMPYHCGEQALCKRPGLWLACRLFWIDAWHCQRTCHCVVERHLQHCIKIRRSCHPQTTQSCCFFFLSFFLKEERGKIRNVPRIRPSKPDKRYFWKTSETGHPSKAIN